MLQAGEALALAIALCGLACAWYVYWEQIRSAIQVPSHIRKLSEMAAAQQLAREMTHCSTKGGCV
jgi:hypothetical protein